MNSQRRGDLPLSPYRVLDLTDEKGYFCGQILAELGVDVIKIEPPGGDPGRNTGPFYHDIPDKNKSLYFFAYNTNKRSITLTRSLWGYWLRGSLSSSFIENFIR